MNRGEGKAARDFYIYTHTYSTYIACTCAQVRTSRFHDAVGPEINPAQRAQREARTVYTRARARKVTESVKANWITTA